ncbi:MAG: transposase [Candidatus Thiodiazotropha sp.]|nr:transposase [Candidatus Thiodiazotropha sp.]MCM8882277.1 transposase [Candidatus Thiodiazotropha sp.]
MKCGNSRQPVFFESDDYQTYLAWLKEGADKHGCAIHAYCLMTNHVHLLLTPESPEAISKTIQFVGRQYVPYINHTYGKSGTLWEGHHKGCVIDSDAYLLTCMRYIELNPVRAGMVQKPIDYRWSSYRGNAAQYTDKLTIPHALYRQLAQDLLCRQFAYRELFRNALEADQVHAIRVAVQTGTPLGNTRFCVQIEKRLKCKVGKARRGRPKGRKTVREKGY